MPNPLRTRALLASGTVVTAAVAVASIHLMSSSAATPAQQLTGTLTLLDPLKFSPGTCYGSGGYSDLREGTTVTAADGNGKIIATGALGQGQSIVLTGFDDSQLGNGASECTFDFALNLPKADFYSIHVAQRSAQTYSYEDLNSRGWDLSLSINL